MARQYISDKIGDEYKEWEKGEIILIKSPTGTGKSTFITNILFKWIKDQHKRMLLLSNRTLLYEQQVNEINKQNRRGFYHIELDTYQSFKEDINYYHYVVCDECHYFFEDSPYNRSTDTVYKQIKNQPDCIIILLSATPQIIETILDSKKMITRKYDLPSCIENYSLYRFKKRTSINGIIKQIREEYPEDKILFFTQSAKIAYETHKLFRDSAFLCSKYSKTYASEVNKPQFKALWDSISLKSKFDCKLLCATTALDNGINIKDDSVKHIIVDVFSPITLAQCIGRKRLKEQEHINIYIREYNDSEITIKKNNAQAELRYYFDFINLKTREFKLKYEKIPNWRIFDFDTDSEHMDYIVNECIRDQYSFIDQFCDYCFKGNDAYLKYICKIVGLNIDTAIDIVGEIRYEKLELVMEKWVDTKLFNDELRREFIDAFFLAVEGCSLNKKCQGYNTMNGILKDNKLPYLVKSVKETKGQNKGKHYWIIKSIDSVGDDGSKNSEY